MKLGVDYYPEHWPQDRWATDAKMMADLGLTYVRVGEFAWSLLEPEEDQFDFAWLDQAVQTLHQQDLPVILGTPTATPPPWLTTKYDIFQRNANRVPLGAGSRRHACANNPAYLKHSERIVTALAEHYQKNPAIIGWQIDNEFSCHRTTRCYCDHCHHAFITWLQERYEDLTEVNQSWGTIFWSAIYTAWEQIPLPWTAPAQHNPGLQLDFRRFSSDSWVDYQDMQIEILRNQAPKHIITHNFMGLGENNVDELDYFDLAAELDIVSWDNYPQGATGPAHVALNHDLMRGFKGKAYWVIEQQPGVVNWDVYNRPVPPNQVRLWTWQGFGHGAESIFYFRWRAARFGQEQYHMGVLRQDASPTQLYHEAKQITTELKRLPNFTPQPASVAILFDYADWWAVQIDPHQGDFSYFSLVQAIHHQLWAAGISVDIIRRGASDDLRQYKAVIVPAPILIDEVDYEDWLAYVERGGRLLVTFRAFAKEQGSIWTDQPLPAELSDLLGLTIEEYLALPQNVTGKTQFVNNGQPYAYHLWAETLQLDTAQPLCTYTDHYWAEKVAVAQNKVGDGLVVTLGCWFNEIIPPPVWQALGLDGVALPFTLPPNVEGIPLALADDRVGLMLLNHNETAATVNLGREAIDLLNQSTPLTELTLDPLGVAILKM